MEKKETLSTSITTKKQEKSEDSSAQPVIRESENSIIIQIPLDKPANTLHPSSRRFYEIIGECGALHAKKQKDYGVDNDPFANVNSSKEFGVPPWIGALIRANDKVTRLKTFAQKGELSNEPVEDSLKDLANYCIIALVLFEKEQRG